MRLSKFDLIVSTLIPVIVIVVLLGTILWKVWELR